MLDTLYLVRHAEVSNPDHVVYADLPGFGLSDVGRRQAEAAATKLRDLDVTAIVTSPLLRAIETARPIEATTGLVSTTDDNLTEWQLGTRWAGAPWDAVDRLFPGELSAYLQHPHDLPFAPEGIEDVAMRMKAAAEHALPGAVALVSHQDPVQALRLQLNGAPFDRLHTDKPGHASISCFTHQRVGWREEWRWQPDVESSPFPPVGQ